jgi:uncharacterized protein involved in outer membrane biogenesis
MVISYPFLREMSPLVDASSEATRKLSNSDLNCTSDVAFVTVRLNNGDGEPAMKKYIKWVVIGLVLLLVVGVVVVYLNLNGIIERTVERQATASLNLNTDLGGANLALFGGSLGLDDLQIASPQGFSAPKMFELDNIAVDVSYGQLREDPVRVKSIRIANPRFVLEQAGGKLNIQSLMDLKSKEPAPEDGEPLKLIIGELVVTGATVVVRPGVPGLQEEYIVDIPPISMSNIGTGEGAQNGAAIKEIVALMGTTMASKAADSDKLPAELRQLLNMNVEQLAARIKDEFNTQVGKLTDDLAKKLPPEVGGVVDKVLRDPQKALENPQGLVEEGINILEQQRNRRRERDNPSTQPSGQ